MSYKVEQLRIQRFKNLIDVTLPLTRVNVLVGANNAGKSAILQAIQFMISAAQSIPTSKRTQIIGTVRFAATTAPTSLFYAPVDQVMDLSNGKPLTQSEDDGLRIDFEMVNDNEDVNPSTHITIARGKNGNLAVRTNASKSTWELLKSLEHPFSMYVPGLAGIATKEPYVTPAAVRRAAARGHGNSILRNVLWLLSQNRIGWDRFTAQLNEVFHGYELDIQHDPEKHENVNAFITGEFQDSCRLF